MRRQTIGVNAFAAILGLAGLAGIGGGGCSGPAIAEGNIGSRTVLASTEGSTVRLRNHDDSVDVDAGGRTVHVTASQLTWAPDGMLALPEQWNRLEIRQFRRKTFVLVDGKQFGMIPPEK